MRIVVTGANGLVGSRLCRHLAAGGHEVFAWARGASRAQLTGARFVSVDLTHADAVSQSLRETHPDVIINPAAMTDVDGCERDPVGAWQANVEAVATLARSARELGSHLLHVSTDYVFDGDAGPYDVDATPNPRGVYAITKYAGEQAVRALMPKGAWAIARTAVVYGWPSTGKNNFGSWLLTSLSSGKPVNLFNDQWISPSHAGNVSEMLAELAERKLPGTWHTAGADVLDRVAFGLRMAERFGFDAALIKPSRMVDVNLPSPRPAKSGLIVSRTAEALTHKPLSTAEALERLFTEYRSTPS